MRVVKRLIVAAVLLVAVIAAAQERERNGFVSVTFAIDGKTVACENLIVDLLLDGRHIVPKNTDQGFTVPSVFAEKPSQWPPDKTVDVSVSCDKYTVTFPKLHPSWVSPGRWELGIEYPPYWMERSRGTTVIERGAWLSYLESECNGCDPGVVTMMSHPDPPASLLAGLHHEQPNASAGRARDIAYALAVFGSEYDRNRDYLVELLSSCLSRPRDSPEDNVCDGKLLDYLTNLYWRGDSELLQPLLQSADSRKDVIDEIGTFYANLLDRRTAAALRGMQEISIDKQRTICNMAGEDDLSLDPPKLERVTDRLRAAQDDLAERCLQAAEKGAGRAP